jgi:hypothetical protein
LRGFLRAIAVVFAAAMVHAGEYSIRWTEKEIEVSGLSAASLRALEKNDWTLAQWQRLLSVRADQSSLIADMSVPAMTGAYTIERKNLRFTPQFPLRPGVKYRAVFRPEALPGKSTSALVISSTHSIPAPSLSSTTVVSSIHPLVDTLPENVLKFYVHFSAPMSGGGVYQYIELLDSNGNSVELPFLEIEQELWDPGMTRLTLLLDPGRIKRGLRPIEEVGPALQEGKSFTLVISKRWPDATGAPMKADFQKQFKVGAADRQSPVPTRWKLVSPKSKSRQPLAVTFDEPLDHAIAERVLHVTDSQGRRVAGTAKLQDEDRVWMFAPDADWKTGEHRLVIPTRIEDLAGNDIAGPFDVDVSEGPRPAMDEVVRLSFTVR